jgi:spore maturation protein CgeB
MSIEERRDIALSSEAIMSARTGAIRRRDGRVMRVHYFGSDHPNSTSHDRAEALRRLGIDVRCYDIGADPQLHLRSRLVGALHYRTGYSLLQGKVVGIARAAARSIGADDVVWIDSGEFFGPRPLVQLKRTGAPLVLYNVDDPTGQRDGNRFKSLRAALPLYDLCAVVRNETVDECRMLGAKAVIRVWRSYDEEAHAPAPDLLIRPEFRSKVAFIGTWMHGRGAFMARLVELGVPLAIWGNRWQKAPEWRLLREAWRGPAIAGQDYRQAILGAEICLGLVSQGNRDLHTQRSAEVPYAGGLFCGQRTSEHVSMYREGVEAVFWDDADECAQVCLDLLKSPERCAAIRAAGHARVKSLGIGNEDVCRSILAELEQVILARASDRQSTANAEETQ